MLYFDVYWMQVALQLASYALQHDEVPIGAVLVKKQRIIGIGWNHPVSSNDPTNHAEINTLRDAALNIGNYRLIDTTLYVTLEPCIMCLGAILHARCDRIVFGAYDSKKLSKDLICKLRGNHVKYEGGILERECGELLRSFFRLKR